MLSGFGGVGGLTTPLYGEEPTPRSVTSYDAGACETKLGRVKAFASVKEAVRSQVIYFTEDEINSWLALRFKSRAHPSLKDLTVSLEDGQALVTAGIDFDRLRDDSETFLPKLIALMFSGVHTITAHGKIISGKGQGMFEVDKARFDDIAIPAYLMNGILSAVGLRQNPPVDPSNLSPLPFSLEHIDVRKGSLLTYQ
ncbi:MAG: hypothetical protein LBP68_06545 [Acidobacteriota bacterium]|jgi:hypothetical protein|nr:hypothetical protein [Acidobacteriota bacterium]